MTNSTWHKGLFLFLLALTVNHCRTSPVLQTAELPTHADPATTISESSVVWIVVTSDQLNQPGETASLGYRSETRIVDRDWAPLEGVFQAQVIMGDELMLDGQLPSLTGELTLEVDALAIIY